MTGLSQSAPVHGPHQKSLMRKFDRILHSSPIPRAIKQAMKTTTTEHCLQQSHLPDSAPNIDPPLDDTQLLASISVQKHKSMEIRNESPKKRRRVDEKNFEIPTPSPDGLNTDTHSDIDMDHSMLMEKGHPKPIPEHDESNKHDSPVSSQLSPIYKQPRLANIDVVICRRAQQHKSPDVQPNISQSENEKEHPMKLREKKDILKTEKNTPIEIMGDHAISRTKVPVVTGVKITKPVIPEKIISQQKDEDSEIVSSKQSGNKTITTKAVQRDASRGSSRTPSKKSQDLTEELTFGGKYSIPPQILESTGSNWESGRRHSRRTTTGSNWRILKRQTGAKSKVLQEGKKADISKSDPYEFSDEE